MAQSDLLDILKEVRGTGPVNGQIDDGIYYEIAINPAYGGHDGMYGHILYIYEQTPALEALQADVQRMYDEIAVDVINGNAGMYGDIVFRHGDIIAIQSDLTTKYNHFLSLYNAIDFIKMEIVADNIADVVTVADSINEVNVIGADMLLPSADSRTETIYDALQTGNELDLIYDDMTDVTYSHILNALANATVATDKAVESADSAALSKEWADNEEDIPVSTNLGFSSKHYMKKSETIKNETEVIRDEALYLRNELSELSVTANTLPEGAEATVQYTFGASLMQFGIPKGDTGLQGLAGIGVNILGSDVVADILVKNIANVGDTWIATDTGFDSAGDPVIVGDMMRATTTGATAYFVNIGPVGVTGLQGTPGIAGLDGLGWTNGTYYPSTGVVVFDSGDGLGFNTGDLRGAAATIAIGTVTTVPFADGADVVDSGIPSAAVFDFEIPEGRGWTGGSYNAATGTVTFVSPDGIGFETGDIRAPVYDDLDSTNGAIALSAAQGKILNDNKLSTAPNSVQTTHILGGAVTEDKLATDVLTLIQEGGFIKSTDGEYRIIIADVDPITGYDQWFMSLNEGFDFIYANEFADNVTVYLDDTVGGVANTRPIAGVNLNINHTGAAVTYNYTHAIGSFAKAQFELIGKDLRLTASVPVTYDSTGSSSKFMNLKNCTGTISMSDFTLTNGLFNEITLTDCSIAMWLTANSSNAYEFLTLHSTTLELDTFSVTGDASPGTLIRDRGFSNISFGSNVVLPAADNLMSGIGEQTIVYSPVFSPAELGMHSSIRPNSFLSTGALISDGTASIMAPSSDTLGNAVASPVGNMYVITQAGHDALVAGGLIDDDTFYIIVG